MPKIKSEIYIDAFLIELRNILKVSGRFSKNELTEIEDDFRDNLSMKYPMEVSKEDINSQETPQEVANDMINELDSVEEKNSKSDIREALNYIIVSGVFIVSFMTIIWFFGSISTKNIFLALLDRPLLFLLPGTLLYGFSVVILLDIREKFQLQIVNTELESLFMRIMLLFPVFINFMSFVIQIRDPYFFIIGKSPFLLFFDAIQIIIIMLLTYQVVVNAFGLSNYVFFGKEENFFTHTIEYYFSRSQLLRSRLLFNIFVSLLVTMMMTVDFNQRDYLRILIPAFIFLIYLVFKRLIKELLIIFFISIIQFINHIPLFSSLPFIFDERYIYAYSIFAKAGNISIIWPSILVVLSAIFLFRSNGAILQSMWKYRKIRSRIILFIVILVFLLNPLILYEQSTTINIDEKQRLESYVSNDKYLQFIEAISIPISISQNCKIDYNLIISSDIYTRDIPIFFYIEKYNTPPSDINFNMDIAEELQDPNTSDKAPSVNKNYGFETPHEFRSVSKGSVIANRGDIVVFHIALIPLNSDRGWLHLISKQNLNIGEFFIFIMSSLSLWLIVNNYEYTILGDE